MSVYKTLLNRLAATVDRMPFSYRVGAAGSALVGVLAFNAIVALQSSQRVDQEQERVQVAMQVEQRIDAVLSLAKDVETGVRGYFATGEAAFLEPYARASTDMAPSLQQLQVSLLANGASPVLLTKLRDSIDSLLSQSRNLIDTRGQMGDGATLALLRPLLEQQKQQMDAVREDAESLRRNQSQALNQMGAALEKARSDARVLILIPSFVSVLLAGFLSFLIVRDLRQRQALEAQREQSLRYERQARSEAEASNQAKDEFVSMISHELRTPLQAILGWTQLLKRSVNVKGEMSPEPLRAPVATIERNARTLAGMIDELLDVSRAITGKVGLSMDSVDLADVVRSSVEVAQPAALAKRVQLELELQSPELQMAGDADRLRQVAINLISNAVKFTPPGGRVRVWAGMNESRLELRVIDTGIGITPEMMPRIFERYAQGSVSTNRQYGGLGLGLAIVKHFVELHGGSVRASSAGSGKGAEFVVSFAVPALDLQPTARPLAGPPPSPVETVEALPLALPAEISDKRLTGLRLLIVDDDADVRQVLESLLSDEGAEVHSAESAEVGFEMLRRLRMDIILSDIGMPNTDGYVFARAVRGFGNAFSATPTTTPMVALTAFSRVEDERRALDSGFNAHLGKPVQFERLIAVLDAQARRLESPAASKVRPISG